MQMTESAADGVTISRILCTTEGYPGIDKILLSVKGGTAKNYSHLMKTEIVSKIVIMHNNCVHCKRNLSIVT